MFFSIVAAKISLYTSSRFLGYSPFLKNLLVKAPDREGISVFYKDKSGAVFHTYSCFARGIDMMNATYQYLDLVPKGRDEQDLPDPQAWVRHHDRYEN